MTTGQVSYSLDHLRAVAGKVDLSVFCETRIAAEDLAVGVAVRIKDGTQQVESMKTAEGAFCGFTCYQDLAMQSYPAGSAVIKAGTPVPVLRAGRVWTLWDGNGSPEDLAPLNLCSDPATVATQGFVTASAKSYAMSAVTAAGTAPPAVTLTGTPTVGITLRVECTTLGARGTSVVRVSIDGGTSWCMTGVVTAATILVLDADGNSTGLTLNMANAAAAVDNVWTATSTGTVRDGGGKIVAVRPGTDLGPDGSQKLLLVEVALP
jgi:hypothetical protein